MAEQKLEHLGIIMDGNRRWAKSQNLLPFMGHKQGAETAKKIIKFCLEKKIKHLSLYTFSLENFKRSETEKNFIFSLLVEEADKNSPELIKNGVKIKFIGDRDYFPKSVIPTCDKLELESKNNSNLNLYIDFCYGGKQEIIAGIKKLFSEFVSGKISEQDINNLDTNNFKNYLWSKDIPDPDLIIRTGGFNRLSNFLLYSAAYSEIYFIDKLWPDLTEQDLEKAIDKFNTKTRNFGA